MKGGGERKYIDKKWLKYKGEYWFLISINQPPLKRIFPAFMIEESKNYYEVVIISMY